MNPINLLKIEWNKRFHEVKDNPERLLNLKNDFYTAHKEEINIYKMPWFINFYEKVMNRYEEVISKVSA